MIQRSNPPSSALSGESVVARLPQGSALPSAGPSRIRCLSTGQPAAMGYCHCESCQQWSASPVDASTLWSPSAVTITRGADQLASFSKTERSIRKWCKQCGGHVLTVHPGWGLVDV